MAEALASLPGIGLLLIAFLDARGAYGFARKYRVLFIDGRLYPVVASTLDSMRPAT